MSEVDVEMLKREAVTKNRREIEQLLKSYAERTGLPIDELNRLRAERQTERRRFLEAQADRTRRLTDEEDAAFRQAMESRSKTLSLLSAPTSVITLHQPNNIFLSDHLGPVDFTNHFETDNSSAKLLIDVNTGFVRANVIFSFLWQNPSQSIAVVDVGTLLRFAGFIEAISDNRLFGGDRVGISISASLSVVRGSGWGNDPDGNPLEGTNVFITGNIFQQVDNIFAEGGGLFGDKDLEVHSFAAKPVGLGTDFVVIPGGASVKFDVHLSVQYSINDDGDVDSFNEVIVDFSSDNRRVVCPLLHLTLNT